jgi:hypothetical protein
VVLYWDNFAFLNGTSDNVWRHFSLWQLGYVSLEFSESRPRLLLQCTRLLPPQRTAWPQMLAVPWWRGPALCLGDDCGFYSKGIEMSSGSSDHRSDLSWLRFKEIRWDAMKRITTIELLKPTIYRDLLYLRHSANHLIWNNSVSPSLLLLPPGINLGPLILKVYLPQ